jgi:hypothetical protein
MFRRIYFSIILFVVLHQNVNCAMKKSWKSAANFDTEIPKFTPFNNEENLAEKPEENFNEIKLETTQEPPSPSPSAETLTKISSKIRIPPQHVAEIFSQLNQDVQKTPNIDSGAFDANMVQDEPSTHEESHQLDIEQVLNDLVEESDTANDSIDNSVETDDELEISPITNEHTNTTQYKVGPLMNVTIDSEDSLVNVNLDQNTLKEIFTGSSSQTMFIAPNPNNKIMGVLSFLFRSG